MDILVTNGIGCGEYNEDMPVKIMLKEVREKAGLSQNQLARKLEMSLGNVQQIEYGKNKSIPLDTLEKLCIALSCEVGDLLVLVKDSNDLGMTIDR